MKKETWKPVTISGFSGILMGAASTYGAQKLLGGDAAAVSEGSSSAAVSHQEPTHAGGNDGLSFKEAFETARAEMGPGHVFIWRGNLYTTYTVEEWDVKTQQEQQQFADEVAPMVVVADIEDAQVDVVESTTTMGDEDVVQVASVPDDEEIIQVASLDADEFTSNTVENDDDDDVRVVGFGDVQLDNGRVITVEELDFNGQRVAVVDLDQDGTPDYVMSDLNHNNQPDNGEVIDLHTGEALTFTNDTVDVNDDLPIFDA